MLNWNPLWPATNSLWPSTTDTGRHTTASQAATTPGNGSLWNPASFLELQAYFWSQVIDANRNFWAMCAATFPGLPAAATAAMKPEVTDAGIEPAAATHAVEDLESVLESQTRFWNHMLDANRNLWSGVTWNVSDAGFGNAANAEPAPRRSVSSAVKRAHPAARKSAATKTKVQRSKHH